jgi:hypothetical protein
MDLLDRPRTYMSVTRFPDGDVKVSGCHRPSSSLRSSPKAKRATLIVQFEAAKRAATVVRDLAKYFQLSYLWTITYRGSVTDRKQVQRDFKKWVRLVRSRLPDFFCVGVFEFHKGGGANEGGIHVHFAVDRYYPVVTFRDAWWRVVGKGEGNVDVAGRAFKDSPANVARYMSKYVVKDFDSLPRGRGEHRYMRSRGLFFKREKLMYFHGSFRSHRAAARILCIFASGKDCHGWVSDDGYQFVFKTYW